MGHRSIQMTVDIYGHAVPGANRAAVDQLDDAPLTAPNVTPATPTGREDDQPSVLTRIIHEGADFGRDTNASAWYKAVATRAFSHDGGF